MKLLGAVLLATAAMAAYHHTRDTHNNRSIKAHPARSTIQPSVRPYISHKYYDADIGEDDTDPVDKDDAHPVDKDDAHPIDTATTSVALVKRKDDLPNRPWQKYGMPPLAAFKGPNPAKHECLLKDHLLWVRFHIHGTRFNKTLVGEYGELLKEQIHWQCGLDRNVLKAWDFKSLKVDPDYDGKIDFTAKGRIIGVHDHHPCVQRALMFAGARNPDWKPWLSRGKWWKGVCQPQTHHRHHGTDVG